MFKLTRYDLVGRRRIWFAISLVLIALGLASLATRGLNLGIDFTGGTELSLSFERPVTTGELRTVLAQHGLGTAVIQVDRDRAWQVFVRTPPLEDATRAKLYAGLREEVAGFESMGVEMVHPLIGAELLREAMLALAVAAAGMILYISIRFEFRFGVTGVVAILHDILITVGAFSLLGLAITAPFVAAVLTIVGYSINATIVIYDRIRENLKDRRKEGYAGIVNRSINESLSRCINTSLTTLMALGAIYLFGGKTIGDFALALIIGIACGTYSSVFVAGPLWCSWKERDERARQARSLRKAAAKAR
ncbi:MAG: protein translocase subunit SecF [bacterium]|nr:protein translocase subunit SecF [bacterium]